MIYVLVFTGYFIKETDIETQNVIETLMEVWLDRNFTCRNLLEPLLVVIAFVPFGDLLGYLRKSRGKDDRYFNDPDIKPKTNLTSKELIRFARDVACGMEFLASNKVL